MTIRPASSRTSTGSSSSSRIASMTTAGIRTAALFPHFFTTLFIRTDTPDSSHTLTLQTCQQCIDKRKNAEGFEEFGCASPKFAGTSRARVRADFHNDAETDLIAAIFGIAVGSSGIRQLRFIVRPTAAPDHSFIAGRWSLGVSY